MPWVVGAIGLDTAVQPSAARDQAASPLLCVFDDGDDDDDDDDDEVPAPTQKYPVCGGRVGGCIPAVEH